MGVPHKQPAAESQKIKEKSDWSWSEAADLTITTANIDLDKSGFPLTVL